MDVFVARQPIFDRINRVYGYTLSFRTGLQNLIETESPDRDSLRVIGNTFFVLGVEPITGGKRAFITFTRELLLDGYAAIIPKDLAVVDLSPDVSPDPAVVEACRAVKEAGILLAIPAESVTSVRSPLAPLADIIRVDFPAAGLAERRALVKRFGGRDVKLIADRLETDDDLAEAKRFGYTHFQGTFFSKPTVVAGKDVQASKLSQLQLLREIHQPDLDISKIEEIIKRDVSLSYKLLRYINSASFGLRVRVRNVKHALVMLGESGLMKWASVVVLTDLGLDKPFELAVNSVVRARFCEAIAELVNLGYRSQDFFIMGLFSMIDAIVGMPMAYIVAGLPLSEDIKLALLGEWTSPRTVLDLAVAYESAQWNNVAELARELGVQESALPRTYRDALEWAEELTAPVDESP